MSNIIRASGTVLNLNHAIKIRRETIAGKLFIRVTWAHGVNVYNDYYAKDDPEIYQALSDYIDDIIRQ